MGVFYLFDDYKTLSLDKENHQSIMNIYSLSVTGNPSHAYKKALAGCKKKAMPNFDRTGPEGQGPKTGRGMGDCYSPSEGQGVGLARRRGFRRWFGCGCRCFPWGWRSLTKQNKKEILDEEEQMLQEELEAIKKEKEGLK